MRPEKARNIINKTFDQFLIDYKTFDESEESKTVSQNWGIFTTRNFKEAVESSLRYYGRKEDDPSEMYYSDVDFANYYSVGSHLYYIADRWRCVGRLLFIKRCMEEFSKNPLLNVEKPVYYLVS